MTDEEAFENEEVKFKSKERIKASIALCNAMSYEEMAKETFRTALIECKRLLEKSKEYRQEYEAFMKET